MSRILSTLLTVVLLFLPCIVQPGPAAPTDGCSVADADETPVAAEAPPAEAAADRGAALRPCLGLPVIVTLAVNALVMIWMAKAHG